jgi:hypothetical protein
LKARTASRPFDGGIDIGILEHQERRVAAELHRRLEHVVGRLVQQLELHRTIAVTYKTAWFMATAYTSR